MILHVQKKRPSADIGVLELKGRLLMGNDSRQIEWSVAEFLKEGVKKVIFDLSGLDSVDSTGVGILVMCHAKLQKVGGSLRIAGTRGIVLDILQMTHLDRLVKFYPSTEEAAQSFDLA